MRRPPAPPGPDRAGRRRGLVALGAWLATGLAGAAAPAAAAAPGGPEAPSCAAAAWPLWQRFATHFIQDDGRVIDRSAQQQSTSEGQSYAMFFALVANDRARFDRLWQWSVANLAAGDMGARLPAWQWGRRADGRWGVLDANSAADADLWFAYALAEAARAWQQPAYERQARALLARVAQDEVARLPGLGPVLLPGREGFATARQWRLNPSYTPMPLLRRFTELDRAGPWDAVARTTVRLLTETTPQALAADWVAYQGRDDGRGGAFVVDPDKGDLGSYDAIRTYLWAGMTARADPASAAVLRRLAGMARLVAATGAVPEKVGTTTGAAQGQGPVGFAAALLPYLQATGHGAPLAAQQARVQAHLLDASAANLPTYYDHVLGLFGTGWMEQRYRFLPSGRVQLRWEKACPHATTP